MASALLSSAATGAAAQGAEDTAAVPHVTPVDVRGEVSAGSDVEQYLRMLQVTGKAPLHPWTLRGFSPSGVGLLAPHDTIDHPWKGRYAFPGRRDATFELDWIRPEARTVYNTTFPHGGNDGAVWAGRGLTGVVRAGFRLRAGPVHLTVDPVAFWTENRRFDLVPNGREGDAALRDPRFPSNIDHPQRFGDGGYGRVDLGTSEISVDLPGSRVYLSGAPEQWGPAVRYPLILGNNAGGFTHAGLATREPLDLWALNLNARYIVGRVEQSNLSPVTRGETDRLLVAFGASATPRGVPGLELGLIRLMWRPWPEGGPDGEALLQVFSGGTVGTHQNPVLQIDENQIASFFMRWVVPDAGFEVYGEFAKEDFNLDFRHTLLEPDDLAGYLLGFQKVMKGYYGATWQIRSELVNTETAHRERGDRRIGAPHVPRPFYTHSSVSQGHTNRGQLLTSAEGYGGAGFFVRLDRFDENGRWSGELSRSLRFAWRRGLPEASEDPDVIYALGLSHTRFLGASELTIGVVPSLNLNRGLDPSEDRLNLRLEIGFRTGALAGASRWR